MNGKKFNVIVSLIILLLAITQAEAQSLKDADTRYAGGAYYSAANQYRQILGTKGRDADVIPRRGEIMFRIGECYRKMNKTEDALKWYEQALQANYDKVELYYGLGCVQLLHGNYEEAKEAFLMAKDLQPSFGTLSSKLASFDIAELYSRVNNLYELVPLDNLNSRGSEFGLAFYGENLIYASTGRATREQKNLSERTGLPYSDLYIASPDSRSYYGNVRKLEALSEEEANDGTFSYDATTNQLYCTRCEANNQNCFILKVSVKDNKYKENGKLKLGNVTYGIGHPYVTDDGKRIYFSSVMEGGRGGSDLWYVDRDESGHYGQPVNLGENINTAGDDVFPAFIDGILYFSSDGHPGLGGLDIYASYLEPDGRFGKAHNLRAPFNSSWDDFNLVKNQHNKTGLLISNRNNSISSDDIYRFNDFPPQVITLDGLVYDNETKELIKEYTVTIKDGNDKIFEKTVNDRSGYFLYVMPEKEYEITATSEGYDPKTETFSTAGVRNFSELRTATYLNVYREPEPTIEIDKGDTVKMSQMEIKDIFYEFNQSRLTEKSKQELDKYVSYFEEYPDMVVEIGAHTDARGKADYNQKLSEARAKSVVDYLISKGVEANRLVWKGYGKEQLLIKNAKTEAEHQANRRTMFKVLTLGLHVKNVIIKQISADEMANSAEGAVDLSGWWVQIHVSSNPDQLHLPVIRNAEQITGKQVQSIRADDGKTHYCIHYNTRNEAVRAQMSLVPANIKTIILQF